MKFIIILCLGVFAISVQTLLFRDFLFIYQGTELAIGIFFLAWFLWVAAGAFIGRIAGKVSSFFINNYERGKTVVYDPS